ncbi:hypothetical protein LguiA_020137 [Lonicera macranthoides]
MLSVGRKEKWIKQKKKFLENDLKQRRIISETFMKGYYVEDAYYLEAGKAEEEDPEEEEENPEEEDSVEQYFEGVEGGGEEEQDPEEENLVEQYFKGVKGGGDEIEALAAMFGGLSLERKRSLERRRRRRSGAGGVVIINDDYRKNMESITGKFAKAQVDKVKLTPWEYLNVPIPPEEREYHETRFECIGISLDPADFRKTHSHCHITDSESETLYQAMKDSEGFDLPSLPYRAFVLTMVTPMYLVNNSDAEKMAKYSKLAVRYYNKIHDKRYVFKRLVKANLQTARGLLFRITFMAMNAHPPHFLATFQAEVFENIGDDIEIMLCRIKPC